MKDIISVLPLAITMMAGPQIIAAIVLLTSKVAIRSSLAYIVAVFSATIIGTISFAALFKYIGISELPKESSDSAIANGIETALIILLVALAIKTYKNRATSKPPVWMNQLQDISPRGAFKLGFPLILLMPSDIVIMITVAIHLISRGESVLAALPFILTTTLFASLPLLTYLLFHKTAVRIMPKVRTWTNEKSWIIQIIVYLVFIILIWK